MNFNDKLKDAFIIGLALPASEDVAGAEYGRTKGWDSVAHMALVAEIEAAFDIMLDTEEVISMSSFKRAQEIVSKHAIDAVA